MASQQKTDMKRDAGKRLDAGLFMYHGGHPDSPTPGISLLEIRENGIICDRGWFGHAFYIPYSQMLSVEFRTEEQVSREVTLGRLLFLGVLAFGLKKKRVDVRNYLVVRFRDRTGLAQTVVFRGIDAPEAAAKISKARQEYAVAHPEALPGALLDSPHPMDIPDQIRKLAELRDAGVLSDQEFKDKKAELLARM